MTAEADIRLLGNLELIGPAGPVGLGGPRPRTMFGLLALRAPRVVSQEALLDGVWGEDPPPSGTRNLHAHMAYLRRSLARADLGDLIVTRAPGYALDVRPEAVDSRRFEELVRRARGAGTPGEIATHLREGLALWRGDALADCPVHEWGHAEVARLREVRLSAVEELLAAEIELGRGAHVVAELEGLVADHPLRERFWELLMLALAEGGRRSDALNTYRRARATLVDQLGLEPGARLRRLEATVLAAGVEEAPRPAERDFPAPVTPLVGRAEEVAELAALLEDHRLVTLVGMGGVGKTRLALAVCANRPEAVFVDLAPLSDPHRLPQVLCDGLGVREDPGVDPVDTAVRHLRARPVTLVLDNCEHVLDSCAPVVDRLLRSCPRLRVLATSREAFGLLGEAIRPVAGLATPPIEAAGLDEVRGYAAVRLFLARAAPPAVRALTDDDAAALARLCRRLDGLPLALELAAARTNVLSIAQIADRVHDPALLHTAQPGGRSHHQAMDATISFSYDLLDDAARTRLRRLGVFHGGFDLDAAQAVWEEDGPSTLDALAGLAAKSLVVVDHRPAGVRYRLLEVIRHFAVGELAGRPAEADRVRDLHARFHLAAAEDADAGLRGPRQVESMRRFAAEAENLWAAKEWFAARGDDVAGLRLAVATARYHRLSGHYRRGRRWLDDALAGTSDGTPVPLVTSARVAAAFLAYFQLAYADSAAHATRALAGCRALGDRTGEARALRLLGSIARERGHYDEARAHYDQALVARADDPAAVADIRQMAGFTAWAAGELDEAEALLGEALRHYRFARDEEGVASTRIQLALTAVHKGHNARARRLAEQALNTFRELGFREGLGYAHDVLGLVDLRTGSAEEAIARLRAGLEIHGAVGDRWRQASVADTLAAAHLATGQPSTAARLLGFADSLREPHGIPVPAQERADREQTVARTRSTLGEDAYHVAYGEGGETPLTLDDEPRPLRAT
ncbi:BTAD domain-containing putative transcriptional regulator [Saccharothrix sp.]|uniref:BTAD domain-containing putative transcriptional regulator n=1 Tax=Saccharothrix sp. TaxID=1873460 RepID=UPI0028117BF0|nr:BTAD domain-containing putative transcriptional regulator [Saccharothrix sp.]